MLRHLSLRGKVLLINSGLIFIIGLVISTVFIYSIYSESNNRIQELKLDEYRHVKENLKEKVDMAIALLENNYKTLPQSENSKVAQEQILREQQAVILETIKNIRWKSSVGYLWITDSQLPYPTMLMHPTLPELEGKIMDSPKYFCTIPNKEHLFTTIAKIAIEKGEGYVEYLWPKPTASGVSTETAKISYIKKFDPYGWVIGAGAYIDDIETILDSKRAELRQKIVTTSSIFLTLLAIGLSLGVFIMLRLTDIYLTRPLKKITSRANELSEGVITEPIPIESNDEIGDLGKAVNKIIETSKSILQQAHLIIKGQYEVVISPRSDQDSLAKSLIVMTETLHQFDEEKKLDNWFKNGLAELNNLAAGDQEISLIAKQIMAFLANYTKAQIASLYFFENGKLTWLSGYACEKNDTNNREFELGEGVIGQAALSRKTITLKDIPESHLLISSSVIKSRPTSIVIVPLLRDRDLVGIMEFGSLNTFSKDEINFLEQAARTVAVAIFVSRSIEQISNLLETTQKQSQVLREQQEELEQANKELQDRTDALEKQSRELEEQREELEQMNIELEVKTEELEKKSRMSK